MEHEFRPLTARRAPGREHLLTSSYVPGPSREAATRPGRGASRGRGRDSDLSLLACFSWMHADVAFFWIRSSFPACYRAGLPTAPGCALGSARVSAATGQPVTGPC